MSDTATLGLAVDSGPVKTATVDLSNFEAVARRTGETVEQVQARFAKLAASANNVAASISAAPVQAMQRGVAAAGQNAVQSFNASALAAKAFINSFNPMVGLSLILQGITAASTVYYALTATNAPKLEKSLEEQGRLLGLVKDAYRDATDKAGEFYNTSRNILKLQTDLNINALSASILDQSKGSVPPAGRLTTTMNTLGGTAEVARRSLFEAFRQQIEEFNASVRAGTPDVEKYREEVAQIGNNNPGLKERAGELLELSQAAANTTVKLREQQSALRILSGTETASDRKRLGIAEKPKTTQTAENPFERQADTIRKQIAVMEADAAAVGKTVGEHTRLRVEAQLLEAGLRGGLTPETVKASERFKELGDRAQKAATDLAKARIASDIKFGKDTAFLGESDVRIATQLRDIYPDVATALSSVEAAAMRTNEAMQALSGSISNGLVEGLSSITNGSKTASQAFADMAKSILADIEKMLIKLYIVGPLMRSLQGMMGGIGGLPGSTPGDGMWQGPIQSANGNLFSGGNVIPFARGGIVGGPTMAPMALMGEAGPEAIMPLRRGSDGKLGVASSGGGVQVINNVNVHNAPANTSVESKPNSSGGIDWNVMVGSAAAKEMAKPGSSLRQVTDQRQRLASR